MDDLKLPIIRGIPDNKKQVSMDDYLRFVLENLKNIANIDEVRQLRKNLTINVPFKFKTP